VKYFDRSIETGLASVIWNENVLVCGVFEREMIFYAHGSGVGGTGGGAGGGVGGGVGGGIGGVVGGVVGGGEGEIRAGG
jgi:hypothetical protein